LVEMGRPLKCRLVEKSRPKKSRWAGGEAPPVTPPEKNGQLNEGALCASSL
jgi:hypothetical protein